MKAVGPGIIVLGLSIGSGEFLLGPAAFVRHGLSLLWVAGVAVYFPVFVEGALLHVGDGHALQGDGEIVGTGIEVPMDVEVTVRVLKGNESTWPRAETEDFVMAVGNARPLDQAVQHATTELIRLLEQDYGLDARAASALLGQCIRYDVGNVFDPAYTMVAKVEKRLLPAEA